ncbi:hypothetical protein P43SY_001434 [Pythium insidiosum]|uniref:FYVE-type domain-containing protein n=1 Tax=Pythium insidiosum TaxID=114742 RepID=A0AAD5Q915_PYTIN|nr:hypothetical protein P43SY_001434 [Pythium insidiosum]
MASTRTQRLAFPLPERALPQIRISPEQHDELRAFAVRTAQDVLRDGPTWARTNVNAARDRGWKVSSRSPSSCFLVKTMAGAVQPVPRRASSSVSDSPAPAASTDGADASADSHRTHSSTGRSRSPPTGATGGGRAFMGYVRLPGYSLDDVISFLHLDNTAAQRAQLSRAFGPAFLDGAVLQTLETAQPQDPFWFLGIKWGALRSPLERLVNHREFVYLEHSGSHVNAQGQRVLYRILQSVSLRAFGGEDAYFGLTRGYIEAAYVYWTESTTATRRLRGISMAHEPAQDGAGSLVVCMKGLAHPKGKIPIWLVERYIKRFWKAGWTLDVTHVDTSARDRHGGAGQEARALPMATAWVADSDRKACAVCQRKFRFGRRMRHHCRACGEVICRACTEYDTLSLRRPGDEDGGGGDGLSRRRRTARSARLPMRSLGEEMAPPQRRVTAGYSADEDDDLLAGLEGFGCYDSDSDRPAALGDPEYTRRSRRVHARVTTENDAVMVGKVCRRCVELKVIALRRETLLSMKPSRGTSVRRVSRRPQETLEEGEEPTSSSPGSTSPRDELPLLAEYDDSTDAEEPQPEPDALSLSTFSVDPRETETTSGAGHRENVARMHLRELLADTDEESDSEVEDRSVVGVRRLHPSRLARPPPALLRSSSAPSVHQQRLATKAKGAVPPPLPSRQFESDLKPLAVEFLELDDDDDNVDGEHAADDERALLSLSAFRSSTSSASQAFSFSSFDVDGLIDAEALDTPSDVDEHEDEDEDAVSLDASVCRSRLQHVADDEELRGSTVSWSSSTAGRLRLHPQMLSLSGMSTASSSGGEYSPSSQFASAYHPHAYVPRDVQSRLTQVEHAIADQAKLLLQIRSERDRQSAVAGRTTIGTQQDWV